MAAAKLEKNCDGLVGAVGVPAKDMALEKIEDMEEEAEGVAVSEWTELAVGVAATEAAGLGLGSVY